MRPQRMLPACLALLCCLMLLGGACNIFDYTHPDGESDSIEKTLGNADAAMKADNYTLAAELYFSVITRQSNNSRARIGYSSAILLRDVQIADIPRLMNAILAIQDEMSNQAFLPDLAGRKGMTMDQYIQQMIVTVSNSCYYRSPVIGIDPLTGIFNLGTNGLPEATVSDGVIPAKDHTTILNYLITKSVHVALIIRNRFYVTATLQTGVDMASFTNDFSGATLSNRAAYVAYHSNYLLKVAALSNDYEQLTNTMLVTDANISALNLIKAAEVMLVVLSNSGMSGQALDDAIESVDDLRGYLLGMVDSLTNPAAGIQVGFVELATFRTNVEYYGAVTVTNSGIDTVEWFPY